MVVVGFSTILGNPHIIQVSSFSKVKHGFKLPQKLDKMMTEIPL